MKAFLQRPYHVLGFWLFMLSVMARFLERYIHHLDIRGWFPGIAIEGLPIWGMPIELWGAPWAELALLAGIGLSLLAMFVPRARLTALSILFVFLLYTSVGGAAVGKALVFMQPMVLFCLILTLMGEFKKERLSLWPARMGWYFLAAMYGFNALSKVGPEWLAGTAFADFTTSNLWGPGWYTEAPVGWGWSLLTYGSLLWELSGFLLVFSWPRFRKYYGISALVFHGALAIMSPFKVLGLAIAGLWLMLWNHRAESETKPLPRVVFSIWILWILSSNLGQLHLPELPPVIRHNLARVSLWPSWRLFAPSPAKGRIEISFSAPGRPIDVITEGGGRMSFMLDAARFDLMWNHLTERLCKDSTGEVVLEINGPYKKTRRQQCSQVLRK